MGSEGEERKEPMDEHGHNHDEALSMELDRLEQALTKKDAELAAVRTESDLKDMLIKELQAALGSQEKMLKRLYGRVEELEKRLSAARFSN